MLSRARTALPALAGLAVFVLAVVVLRRELSAITWREFSTTVLRTPPGRLSAALLLTALSYASMACYDLLAFAYVGKRLSRWRIAFTSLVAYAVANNVGFAIFSGVSVRYRFYRRWGVTAEEFSKIIFSYTVTFWLGLFALGGLSLMLAPQQTNVGRVLSSGAVATGAALLLVSAGYVAVSAFRRSPFRLGRFELRMPTARVALAQLLVSSADWALASSVLIVLLPPGGAPASALLGAFLVAQLLALASHVPGGVGVFEGTLLLLLQPYLTPSQILPALVVYRAVYYLLPFSIALTALIVDGTGGLRRRAATVVSGIGHATERVAPRLLAVCTFAAGVLLLLSGATPPAADRIEQLGRYLPLGIIETSHVLGSVAGAALLLLSQALSRRLDAAYYLTLAMTITGVGASLLKGGDYEEAIALTMLIVALRRARPAFTRRAALFATRFSGRWIAAVVSALVASVWLGLFAFRHVDYSHDLWWRFELNAAAPRFLRGTVGAASVVLLFALARLIRHAPHQAAPPSEQDLRDAGAAIAAQRSTMPHLVYLRDKSLLFDDRREGFVMYAVKGRTWAALGDPVGPEDRLHDLVRLFLEKCDDYGGTPVFYEVSPRHLHIYADFGLTLVKLGEEARVDLRRFTLDGPEGARYRQCTRRLDRDGGTFRLLEPGEAGLVMDQLQDVSDDWLLQKAGSEKGFSLGFFDPDYISRFPVAVVERAGRIQAFANLWPGPNREELSIDLMRYHRDAPKGVMEPLFVRLMQWGKSEGYRWFSLGMAPMSGFEPSPVAPFWSRAGRFLFEHGGPIYNFQGLRSYKEKFQPVWDSRYLAYPGGLTLPRILADISALVAGGYSRIFVN